MYWQHRVISHKGRPIELFVRTIYLKVVVYRIVMSNSCGLFMNGATSRCWRGVAAAMIPLAQREHRRVSVLCSALHVCNLERIFLKPGIRFPKIRSELPFICSPCWFLTPFRWLYALFMAIDANFHLKYRAVLKDTIDPSLSQGWAYFIEESSYKSHISEHSNTQQEVFFCFYSGSVSLTPFLEKYLLEPQCS